MLSKSTITSLIVISFIIGILFGLNFSPIHPIIFLFVIILSITAFFNNAKIIYFFIIILGLIIGIYRIQHYTNQLSNYTIRKINNQNVSLTGIIHQPPDSKNNKQHIQLTNIKYKNKPITGNLLIIAHNYPPYQYGQTLNIRGKPIQPENFTEDFSYTGYLAKDQIFSTIIYPEINIISYPKHTIHYHLFQLRQSLLNKINHTLPYPNSGLLSGLILGIKNALPTNIYEQFRSVGLTHIIVVSGFNLTIFATIFLKFLRGKINRLLGLLFTIIFITCFTLLTGAEASIFRALIMTIILITAPFFSRKNNPTIAILLAAGIMIYLNPLILWYDAGFHLSFLATCGLIYFTPTIKYLYRKIHIPQFISNQVTETSAALVTTTPYIMYSFNHISSYALLSNLLVLPVIPIAMIVGIITLFFSYLMPHPLIQIITIPINSILSYIMIISEYLSKIPYSYPTVSIPLSILLMYYTALFGYIIYKNKVHKYSYKTKNI